jgi:hypothetical protein
VIHATRVIVFPPSTTFSLVLLVREYTRGLRLNPKRISGFSSESRILLFLIRFWATVVRGLEAIEEPLSSHLCSPPPLPVWAVLPQQRRVALNAPRLEAFGGVLRRRQLRMAVVKADRAAVALRLPHRPRVVVVVIGNVCGELEI